MGTNSGYGHVISAVLTLRKEIKALSAEQAEKLNSIGMVWLVNKEKLS